MRAHRALDPENGVVNNLLPLFSTTRARSWKIVGSWMRARRDLDPENGVVHNLLPLFSRNL
jgi:hypothetical protein